MLEPATAKPPSPALPRERRRRELRAGWPKPTASSEGSRDDFEPPRPVRAAALLLAPLPLLVALWVAGVLPAPIALGLGVFQVFFALVQGGFDTYELRRSRRLGDALLRAYPGLQPVSGLAAWRSAELTSARNRRRLTRRRASAQTRDRSLPTDARFTRRGARRERRSSAAAGVPPHAAVRAGLTARDARPADARRARPQPALLPGASTRPARGPLSGARCSRTRMSGQSPASFSDRDSAAACVCEPRAQPACSSPGLLFRVSSGSSPRSSGGLQQGPRTVLGVQLIRSCPRRS